MQKSEIELLSYTTHKIDMKWVKDLNLRLDTIKLLRENMGRSSLAFLWSMIFFFFFLRGGYDIKSTSKDSTCGTTSN